MFSKGDYRWDSVAAVDVKGGSELLRRGMIQDLIAGYGFIVDFDHKDHHQDVIRFGDCVASRPPTEDVDYETGKAVETLFRQSLNQPWRWYPSKILLYNRGIYNCYQDNLDSYAFVEIYLDGETIREVVVGGRVRIPLSLPYAPLMTDGDKRGFYKHSFRMPPYLSWVISLEQRQVIDFPKMWARWTAAKIVGNITGGWLVYISRDQYRMTYGETIRRIKDIGNSQSQKELSNPLGRPLVSADAAVENNTCETAGPLPSDDDLMASLARNIQIEILTLLNTDDQLRSRKVCTNWNSILKAGSASVWMEIDLRNSEHRLASTLYKMLNSSVGTLVLNGNHGRVQNKFANIFGMLRIIGVRVPTIVITRTELPVLTCKVGTEKLSSDGVMSAFIQIWRPVCKKIVFDQVKTTVSIEGPNRWNRSPETSLVKRTVVQVTI